MDRTEPDRQHDGQQAHAERERAAPDQRGETPGEPARPGWAHSGTLVAVEGVEDRRSAWLCPQCRAADVGRAGQRVRRIRGEQPTRRPGGNVTGDKGGPITQRHGLPPTHPVGVGPQRVPDRCGGGAGLDRVPADQPQQRQAARPRWEAQGARGRREWTDPAVHGQVGLARDTPAFLLPPVRGADSVDRRTGLGGRDLGHVHDDVDEHPVRLHPQHAGGVHGVVTQRMSRCRSRRQADDHQCDHRDGRPAPWAAPARPRRRHHRPPARVASSVAARGACSGEKYGFVASAVRRSAAAASRCPSEASITPRW